MKTLFALMIFLGGLSAGATTYTFVPDSVTRSDCESMGMTGDFQLHRYKDSDNPDSRKMVFLNSGEDLPLTRSKADRKLYTTLVRCAYGCVGEMEIRLDFNNNSFLYKRDIWYQDGHSIDELCRGVVR